MRFPSPTDPAGAPVWDNYIAAQCAHAMLGLIPSSALAVGVEVDGLRVELVFRLASPPTDVDLEDIADIEDEFSVFVGDAVEVSSRVEVREHAGLSPYDGIGWVFKRRD